MAVKQVRPLTAPHNNSLLEIHFIADTPGYHAKTSDEFAEAIHTALSLPEAEQKKMREAARNQAKEKFSQEKFEKGWEGVWEVIQRQLENRRGT